MIIHYVNDVKGTQDLSYILNRNVKWRHFDNTYNTDSEKWLENEFTIIFTKMDKTIGTRTFIVILFITETENKN